METVAGHALADTSGLYAHLGFWLRFVSNHVSGRFRRELEAHGSSLTEWVALRTLHGQPHTTNAALIEALGMTKGAASKIISRLEQKGLARRQRAEGSAREQVLSLTKRGRALVPRLTALADANEAHFFGHMSPHEREVLMAVFQDLVRYHGFTNVPTD